MKEKSRHAAARRTLLLSRSYEQLRAEENVILFVDRSKVHLTTNGLSGLCIGRTCAVDCRFASQKWPRTLTLLTVAVLLHILFLHHTVFFFTETTTLFQSTFVSVSTFSTVVLSALTVYSKALTTELYSPWLTLDTVSFSVLS